MTHDRSPARLWGGAALAGLVAGTAALFAVAALARAFGADVERALRNAPVAAAAIVAAPLLAALVAAFLSAGGRRDSGTGSMAAASPGADAKAAKGRTGAKSATATLATATGSAHDSAAALELLALLQQEGRFVDFLQEDISPYSDEQIGAAIRAIHKGCREALRGRLELTAVLAGEEGATVTIERGFDPAAVRVTGNVRGEPPYRGVLRHPGWRSIGLTLPARRADHDVTIVAPAEVEVL